MAKNNYIKQRDAIRKGFFDAGLRSGQQQIIDMLSLVLRDPDIVGKNTFGRDRLVKVVNGIYAGIKEYNLAWQRDDETDVWRERLDDALKEAYGEELFSSFEERYPYSLEYDYSKGRWK